MNATQDPPATLEVASMDATVAELVELAHIAPSISSFYRHALPLLGRCLGAAYVELEVRRAGTILHESWSDGRTPPEFWEEATQTMLIEALSTSETNARYFIGREVDLAVGMISAPIGNAGRRGGALVAAVPVTSRSAAEESIEALDVLCSLASSLVESIDRPRAQEQAADEDEVARIRKVGAFTSEVELGFAITNRLRTRDDAVQVALASVVGSRLKLLSISGLDDISPRSPGVKAIRYAMQECVDLGVPVVDQEQGLDASPDLVFGARLHRQWREALGSACVASVPLVAEGEVVAVLSIQRKGKASFEAEEIAELRDQVEPYAAGLEMVRIARRSLFRHIRDTVSDTFVDLFAPRRFGRKVVLAGIGAAGSWVFMGALPYSIDAPCEVVTSAGRHVAARTDGILIEAGLAPGDTVQTGDILCRFETTQLELEGARLRGELAMLDVDVYRALGEGAAADAEFARVKGKALAASLALVEQKIESATVRAPIDGVVLEGDHRARIGDSFAKGETLYRLSPEGEFRLEIRVPERDVDTLYAGMTGEFASHARPGEASAFVLRRIAPMADSSGGDNVFIAEADSDLQADWLRTGMEGFASIDAGERSPAWLLGHRLVDFVRLHLWL